MRILLVTQRYYPDIGGGALKAEALAKHVAERGHGVTVLTAASGSQDKTLGQAITAANPRVVYLPSPVRYRSATLNPGVWGFCVRHLRAFDVVHIYGLYDLLGPAVAWLSRRRGIPYVVEPLGMFRPQIRSIGKKRIYHMALGKRMMKNAARIVVTSDLERRELLDGALPAPAVVLRPNGLDLRQFAGLPARGGFRAAVGMREGEALVVYLGRLSLIKGVDLLVPAFAGLQANARLVLVGPDDRDGCLDLIRQHLSERIVLRGPLHRQEKLAALSDADLCVLPSRYDSFGAAAAEAIACGVPVLVTDRCGIAPLIKDRVGLVVPCETEAIREGLARLLGDGALRQRFRARCAEVAPEFSWDGPVAQMEAIYEQAIRGTTRPGDHQPPQPTIYCKKS